MRKDFITPPSRSQNFRMKQAADAAKKAAEKASNMGGPEGPANLVPLIGALLGTSAIGYFGYNAIYNGEC